METVRIRDPGWKKVGSGINIPDPPHCIRIALVMDTGFAFDDKNKKKIF
jgi:hypothetical protein